MNGQEVCKADVYNPQSAQGEHRGKHRVVGGTEGVWHGIGHGPAQKEGGDAEQKQPLKKEDNNVEILTAKQLARKMALSVDAIQKGCRKGIYPGAKKINGKWMIPCSRGDRNDD